MQRIDIPQIIAYLAAQPSVSAIVGSRIYWGLPKSEQTGTYLVIDEVTENQDTVEAVSRLAFRFQAHDDNTNWSQLYAAERAVTQLIANKGPVKFGTFDCHKVLIAANLFSGVDEKTRKTYIRDYLFHFQS